MNHFDYRNGVLHAEAVNLIELADAVGTPFYCYSTATLERHYRVFTEAFAGEKVMVCYAMKANSNQSVLRTLAKLGAGAEFCQRAQHRLVGVGLHGVAHHYLLAGEGLGEDAVVPLQRRGRIAIERRADRIRQLDKIHRLGVQHAVAIVEVVHGWCSSSNIRIPSRRALLRMLEPKGTLAKYNSGAAMDLTFAMRTRGKTAANVKSTAPAQLLFRSGSRMKGFLRPLVAAGAASVP